MIVDPVLLRIARSGALGGEQLAGLVTQTQGDYVAKAAAFASLPPDAQLAFRAHLGQRSARRTVTLGDGTIGYFERPGRTDDCFAACLATCLQVPLDEVPDPRLDERLRAGEDPAEINRSAWQTLAAWLTGRGLQVVVHDEPPFEAPRWIGVVRFPGHFNDHCLVMAGAEVLFDPVDRAQHERPVRNYTPDDVAAGLSFQPLPSTPKPVER